MTMELANGDTTKIRTSLFPEDSITVHVADEDGDTKLSIKEGISSGYQTLFLSKKEVKKLRKALKKAISE